MAARLVTVFGGSGFLGRHLVSTLAKRGHLVRVAVRRPDEALFLKPQGDVGQITPVAANLRNRRSVEAAAEGAWAVVNLVGLLYERGRQRFEAVHVEGARAAAEAAKAAGAERFVQVSAIGADPQSSAAYARTKAAGEAAVLQVFPDATIIRPSILFGPEDDFFNRFAAMARVLPALPLIGGGRTRFQPAYVGDVAEAIARVLENPATRGRSYELGGPKAYSFKQLLEIMLKEINRRRLLLPLPFPLARLEAAFLELLPKPPLTRDQVRLLERDNVVVPGVLGFADLGIQPTALELVLPTYLARYRPGGRHAVAA
jgi:NADH dehydrogenase